MKNVKAHAVKETAKIKGQFSKKYRGNKTKWVYNLPKCYRA